MNTRLNWHVGMELTPDTFIVSDNLKLEREVIIRKILASKMFGLIPDVKFELKCEALDGMLMVDAVRFNALLPSGDIIQIDDMKHNRRYEMKKRQCEYFSIEMLQEKETYTINGIERLRNKYNLCFKSLPELEFPNVLPLLKVSCQSVCRLDTDYVPPVMSMRSSIVLLEYVELISKNIKKIISHKNFTEQCQNLLVNMLTDNVIEFPVDGTPSDYAAECRKFVKVISACILKKKIEIPVFNINDMMQWFKWFESLCAESVKTLDSIVEEVEEPKPAPKSEPQPKPVEFVDIFIPKI